MFSLGLFFAFVISTIAASNTPDCRRRMEMLPYACKESVKNLVVKEISATKEGKSMDYDCIFEYGALVKLEGGDARLRKVFPGLRYKAWRSFSKPMSSSEFNETSFVKEAVKEILEDPSPMAPSRKYGCNFRDLEEGNGKKRYELACLFG